MNCPICTESYWSQDVSVIEKKGNRVRLQGRVNAVVAPHEAHYPPFAELCTVSLYPRRGSVKYLKFMTKDEMNRWGFNHNDRVVCEGCLHVAHEKQVVFDVSGVEHLAE